MHLYDFRTTWARSQALHQAMVVHRRFLMDERKRHEFRETSGVLLDVAQERHVPRPVPAGLDVAVHDGRRGADAELVRGRHDLDPLRGADTPFGDDVANAVVENLDRKSVV